MFLANRSKDGLMVEWLVRTEFDIKKLYFVVSELNSSLHTPECSCVGGL